MVSPLARRSAVKYLVKQRGSSQRHACVVVGLPRSLARYIARCRKDEAELIKKIHELAIRHSRYGYRRITVLLRREGWKINKKRVHRIWKSEGLGLPRRRPKRHRMGITAGIVNKAEYPDHVWSYDFVTARTADGRAFRMLTIIDEYTRECLAILAGRRLTSEDVIDQLFNLFILRGTPEHIRSDNGPEFTAKAIRKWLERLGIKTLFIEPGSPWENGYIESFNGKLRDELLNREFFTTLEEAKVLIEQWRKEYNQVRPHSALGYRPPAPEAIITVVMT